MGSLVTTKVHLKSIIHELIWFIKALLTSNTLRKTECPSGTSGADGDLGPVYGAQWRSWPDPEGGSVDQIQNLIEIIKKIQLNKTCCKCLEPSFS